MGERLFVYGTLLPGLASPLVARVPGLTGIVARFRPVASGWLAGRLYDLGSYPGAVPDPEAPTRIRGEVVALPDEAGLIELLDAYEGYRPGALDNDFARERRLVTLEAGPGAIECWVYAYLREPGRAPLVPEGDYRAYRRSTSLVHPGP